VNIHATRNCERVTHTACMSRAPVHFKCLNHYLVRVYVYVCVRVCAGHRKRAQPAASKREPTDESPNTRAKDAGDNANDAHGPAEVHEVFFWGICAKRNL